LVLFRDLFFYETSKMKNTEATPVAITRPLSSKLAECELTHLSRSPIDIRKAREEHKAYEQALRDRGYSVKRLAETDDLPDGVFVEDCAVVLPEAAILTRPGAASRRPELKTVRPVLSEYRELKSITAPATLDGGDVLVAGKVVFVGLSQRTNAEGLSQFSEIVTPLGYTVVGVPLTKCLHLKTAVTCLSDDHLLLNPDWVDRDIFKVYRITEVHPDEPFAANVVALGKTILCSASCPKTARKIEDHGYSVVKIDQSELAKAEAGLTCCSLLIG
jgi:dimethylargininase